MRTVSEVAWQVALSLVTGLRIGSTGGTTLGLAAGGKLLRPVNGIINIGGKGEVANATNVNPMLDVTSGQVNMAVRISPRANAQALEASFARAGFQNVVVEHKGATAIVRAVR